MVAGKTLFLNLEVTVFRYQRDESVARVVWVFDDAGCLFEDAPPVDPFNGGEVSTLCPLLSVVSFALGGSGCQTCL